MMAPLVGKFLPAKESIGIVRCDLGAFLLCDLIYRGKSCAYVGEVCGFVSCSAVGDRCHPGGIRFKQDVFDSEFGDYGA